MKFKTINDFQINIYRIIYYGYTRQYVFVIPFVIPFSLHFQVRPINI